MYAYYMTIYVINTKRINGMGDVGEDEIRTTVWKCRVMFRGDRSWSSDIPGL